MDTLFELFHSDISLGEALIYAVIGYVMVFLMLVLLIIVIKIMAAIIGKAAGNADTKAAPAAVTETPKAEAAKAPGSAGELTLIDVSDRDAAMIMAIVADSLGKPINELRFKSIREVKEDE
jgi:Na+-transporting methylmalonyl-CoA/oxaloacetate decarboxylase gamma subunit